MQPECQIRGAERPLENRFRPLRREATLKSTVLPTVPASSSRPTDASRRPLGADVVVVADARQLDRPIRALPVVQTPRLR